MKQLFLILLMASTISRSEAQEPAYPAGFSLTMSRSACLGSCPAYRVTVDGQGLVTFEPEEFTSITEPRTFKLPAHKAWDVAAVLEDAWFFERPAAYVPGKANCSRKRFRTDHPRFEISASLDDQRSTVRVNEGCLEVDHTLMDLPSILERILGIDGFVHGEKG